MDARISPVRLGWGALTLCGIGIAAIGFVLDSDWIIVAPLFGMTGLSIWQDISNKN